MYIYAYPSADTISSISAVDAVIAHVVMAVRFSVVAPGFLYTDENWVLLLLLYSFHPIAEITLKNANIKDEFKGASTRIN